MNNELSFFFTSCLLTYQTFLSLRAVFKRRFASIGVHVLRGVKKRLTFQASAEERTQIAFNLICI